MIPAQVIIYVIVAALVAITGFAVYTAFGPPSKALEDPYEMHED
ncbi:photosystem II reaction center protein PsbN [Candidatus Cyanaurora vandensis]|nr:photosystem II reaction center protein PsbN [Candidatus Cyanaurora vandensis]